MTIRRLTCEDPGYPAGLRDLADPPPALFVAGELPPLARAVAIVGTRRADVPALQFTRWLASELARAGCTIISGGARGIDSAAHEGALDVEGRTVAVLPGSLDEPYPPRNRPLFQRIERSGALLSEGSADPRHYASDFLARNRLIAALAQLVIVAQAPARSGALSTAAHARTLARPLLAVPFAPWELRGEGCASLLARGARVCRTSEDVLALLAVREPSVEAADSVSVPPKARAAKARARRPALAVQDVDERAVQRALSGSTSSADELCARTRLSPARVQRALLMLLLSGSIVETAPGRYVLVARH